MANKPKVYVCKYCGKERIVTNFHLSKCKHCGSKHALVRREEDKIPMYKTRLEKESEHERS